MPPPSVDIIVPVWNSPFETRACLAAILEHSPDARLIIIDNGSSRETQQMLEEFSEPLEESSLFITSDRNIGLVPAINRGLASSDGDFAVIVRPHVSVYPGWLERLLAAGAMPGTGIVTPVFHGSGAPSVARPIHGCTLTETFSLSFSTLLIRGELQKQLGGFDEHLDGGEWCLRDYMRRAEARGYYTCVTSQPELLCSEETVFGSPQRRQEQARVSREKFLGCWGISHHYCLYFGSEADAGNLSEILAAITAAARRGHRFSLLLHGRQYKEFRRRGWNALHTGISTFKLPFLATRNGLVRQLTTLQTEDPNLIPVRGDDSVAFPCADAAICLSEIVAAHQNGVGAPVQWNNALEVT